MSVREAVGEARKLLAEYGIQEPPVPVETIARGEGALIARNHFEGSQSGFILRNSDRVVIGVNTATSPRRQRFTIAHELGHLTLHPGNLLIVDHSIRVNWRDHRSSMATDQQEIEANAFAAEILMPRALVESYFADLSGNKLPDRDEVVSILAQSFDVSTEAMGFRLVNLGILAA